MGNLQTGMAYQKNPDVVPHPHKVSKYDPNFGFSQQREPKVMIATPEELHSAKIDLEDRDYCAHHLIQYRKCYKEKFPWIVKCAHEKHVYLNCEYDEFIDRMKDYEREWRLNEREKRKAAAA